MASAQLNPSNPWLSGNVPRTPRKIRLDCGTVLSTDKKTAFSEGSRILFLMIHMN
ncbi:rCG27007, isoform CRA_b [Rattus norvegicus]|uniref:RCG27007, isoform CRA_b n=1 Tax=Rattus norvegicus TaxID=10116 RepID=A6HNW1_RAT|nr:rCG27007, isoform CRA_b [Rattus norvegicus]